MIPFKQQRTPELDLHWQGFWYCITCGFYTGQLNVHQGHYIVVMPRVVVIYPSDFQSLPSFVPYVVQDTP